ncbi:MAG: LysR family transcriptional regulator [Burkholderiaceae bacterium]
MDIKQLTYFLHVADAGSFNQAAARIGIAQPALSRQVVQLERELNVQLFERDARGVRLTDAGRSFELKARDLLRRVDEITAEMRAGSEQPSGTLTVGVPQSLRSMLVLGAVEEFSSAHPGVFLRIVEDTTAALRQSIALRQADLAVLSTVEPESTLATLPLLSERMFLVGPRQAALDPATETPIGALARLPLIQLGYPNALRALLETALARKKIRADVRFETNTLLMLDMAIRGLGYTVLPYCAIDEVLRAGRVTASPVSGLRISWVLAHSRELPLSPAAREFVRIVRERVASLVAQRRWQTASIDFS